MKESDDDIVKLIRLKRFEQPPEGYFDTFVSEFQRRQRAELLNCSARGILCERIATYFSGFTGYGKQPWMIGAGAAAMVTLSVVFLLPAEDNTVAAPQVTPMAPMAPMVSIGENEGVLWNHGRPAPSVNRLLPVHDPPRVGPLELIPVSSGRPKDF